MIDIKAIRELCEKATPGPWEVKLHNEDYGQGYGETTFFVDMYSELLKLGIADYAEKWEKYSTLAAFISRSRTLIPALCDALEESESERLNLANEVARLARESIEREKMLARLEAEVAAAIEAQNAQRWIPVTERLPEKNQPILAFTPAKGNTVYTIEACEGLMCHAGKFTEITHWMPLPEPPKGDK